MSGPHEHKPTPLLAVCAVTFLASIGTGVVWNGVAFIAKHDYKFSENTTLLLYVMMGATYVVGALSTGRVLRKVEQWTSPRSALAAILFAETLICASLWLIDSDWMIWCVACAISVLSSWLWPIIESYLTAGRHGPAMRNVIGWWNLCWTSATAAGLVLMMPVMREEPSAFNTAIGAVRLEPRMSIVLLGLMHAVAIIPLVKFEKYPGAHDVAHSNASIQSEYPYLLRTARMLLPLSYVLNAAMSPLLPFLFDRIDLAQHWETTVASTWMWVRIVAMAIMWQLPFWHGRWGTLLFGGMIMAIGFALVITATGLPIMILGLSLFGSGMGVVYYTALYYAMAVGRAEVDAGGTHEALIGVGYTVGPAASMAGLQLGQGLQQTGWHTWHGAGVVAVVWGLIGVTAVSAIFPYLEARRKRWNSTGNQP